MNYYNYFTEIEDEFVKRRGSHILISPLDWSLIETWRQRAIPLAIVLRGINASFEFHVGNWLGGEKGAIPIEPEAVKLRPNKTLCIYGEDEKDSLCPRLAPGSVEARVMTGGHHFDGAYGDLASLILERVNR